MPLHRPPSPPDRARRYDIGRCSQMSLYAAIPDALTSPKSGTPSPTVEFPARA